MRATALLSALPYVLNDRAEKELYRKYISDTLYYNNRNQSLAMRYTEVIGKDREERDSDPRTGDEIAADIIKGLGLKQDESI